MPIPPIPMFVSDCIKIMHLALGRRNNNDPDSTDAFFLEYLNQFVTQTMSNDVRLFEQYGTLQFTVDNTNTTGVYSMDQLQFHGNNVDDFMNLSFEAFVCLSTTAEDSISWNRLYIYQDPGIFFQKWGIENSSILIPGYPTELLLYDSEITIRTIPDQAYDITIYGYKMMKQYAEDDELPYNYWLRYMAYGAALNYARDFRYETDTLRQLEKNFSHERILLLTKTHNQIKNGRCFPRF